MTNLQPLFLVDESLSPSVSDALSRAGYRSAHVRDLGLRSAPDERVFEEALRQGAVLVSADTDFGALLALRNAALPSLVLFRGDVTRLPAAQADLLLTSLPALEEALAHGAVVTIEAERIRVRTLPIVDPGGDR